MQDTKDMRIAFYSTTMRIANDRAWKLCGHLGCELEKVIRSCDPGYHNDIINTKLELVFNGQKLECLPGTLSYLIRDAVKDALAHKIAQRMMEEVAFKTTAGTEGKK